jgi:hypothetical protein
MLPSNVQRTHAERLAQFMERAKIIRPNSPIGVQFDLLNRRYIVRFMAK